MKPWVVCIWAMAGASCSLLFESTEEHKESADSGQVLSDVNTSCPGESLESGLIPAEWSIDTSGQYSDICRLSNTQAACGTRSLVCDGRNEKGAYRINLRGRTFSPQFCVDLFVDEEQFRGERFTMARFYSEQGEQIAEFTLAPDSVNGHWWGIYSDIGEDGTGGKIDGLGLDGWHSLRFGFEEGNASDQGIFNFTIDEQAPEGSENWSGKIGTDPAAFVEIGIVEAVGDPSKVLVYYDNFREC